MSDDENHYISIKNTKYKDQQMRLFNKLKFLSYEQILFWKTDNIIEIDILQYDINNTFLKEFKNAYYITQELGINKSLISACCKGKLKSIKGFIFKYKNNFINIENEIWKELWFNNKIINVSNFGRIKSNGKLLKGWLSKQGYLLVSISNNKIRKNISVHRLVAECFLDNPDKKDLVNHKDQNKQNNHLDNLEWCTYSENSNHFFYNGTGSILCKKIKFFYGGLIRIFLTTLR